MHAVHHVGLERRALPTIHQLTHALKICMSADDHAPPHFDVKGPGFDVMVGLADLQVLQGEFERRDLAMALSWAAQNREPLERRWRSLNERD